MKFFVLVLAVLVTVASRTNGSRLPVVALTSNKAKLNNNKELVMKLRGGGMAIGPLNAGNILDVNSVVTMVYALQIIFAKDFINGRYFTDGLGHPKASFTANALGMTMFSQAFAGLMVSREAPHFKGIYGKISAITWLVFSAYYGSIKFVSNPYGVKDSGAMEGMIVCGLMGLITAAIFM